MNPTPMRRQRRAAPPPAAVNPLDLDAVKTSGTSSDETSMQLIADHQARTEAEFMAELRRPTGGDR